MRRVVLKIRTFPHIGLRIIKSAAAVALCFAVSFLRGNTGIVFYSQLAALWCMQVYAANTKKNAIQRTIGTVIGAIYGLIILLLTAVLPFEGAVREYVNAAVISASLVAVLYTTVLIKKKQASYFSCVVFLSIVVNHMEDSNPYLFVWNRFLDTMIGIVIGVGVNAFRLPRRKRQDVLFVSGLDDTLLNRKNMLTDYGKVELNRMLDDGMNFTLSTMRTPASLMEPMADVRLKLPVITMNGAALYDIRQKRYLKIQVISQTTAGQVLGLAHREGLSMYSTVIVDDMLVIYYDETDDDANCRLVNELRKSPFRNYVKRPLPDGEYVVYFMLLYPSDVTERFYEVLKREGITDVLRVLKYPSNDYPGYSYIKIYNKNATRENMMEYLKEITGIDKVITFGSIRGRYDYVCENDDTDSVVTMLRRLYEPVGLPRFLYGGK